MEFRYIIAGILVVVLITVIFLGFVTPLFPIAQNIINLSKNNVGFKSPSGLYGETPPSTVPQDVQVRSGGPVLTRPKIDVNYEHFGELNYADRSLSDVNKVVLHHTGDDNAAQTINTLKAKGLSVHYVVDRDGTIYYLVDETKTAFHCGCCRPSDTSCLNKYSNPPVCLEEHPVATNLDSIGIEIVNTGEYSDEYTEEQYSAINALVKDVAERWMIPLDDNHIVGHYEVTQGKWDPSPNFDWSRIGLADHVMLEDLGKTPPSWAGYP
ncbi:MAG TPA: N-acetylmuramoyl-L-alanine amidase [Candidatus Woesearchaeota archaeon]|nr:N-acetylmuramoyl-L-alanine amidase [Candidatus Woesearchaeota archaeon]